MAATEPLLTLRGVNGQLELHPDHLLVRHFDRLTEWLSGIIGGHQVIYLDQITGVYLHDKPSGRAHALPLVIKFTEQDDDETVSILYYPEDAALVRELKSTLDGFFVDHQIWPLKTSLRTTS
jgi:hypothetical protein